MNRTLFVLNDPPYGTERTYNGLRLAGAISKREGEQVRVFIIGDGASATKQRFIERRVEEAAQEMNP